MTAPKSEGVLSATGEVQQAVSRRDLATAVFKAAGLSAVALGAWGLGPRAAEGANGKDLAWVDSVEELRTLDGSFATVVVALGFRARGDGGGGIFVWQKPGDFVDDGGLKIPGSTSGGYWQRIFSGDVNVLWFGARWRPDYAGGDYTGDDQPAIQAAINAVAARGGGVVFFPRGHYQIKQKIRLPRLHCVHRMPLVLRGEAASSFSGGFGAERLICGKFDIDNVNPDMANGTTIRSWSGFPATPMIAWSEGTETEWANFHGLENLTFQRVNDGPILKHPSGEDAPATDRRLYHCWIKNCRFHVTGTSARTVEFERAYHLQLENVEIDGGNIGLALKRCLHVTMDNVHVPTSKHLATVNGLLIEGSGPIVMRSCRFDGYRGYAMKATSICDSPSGPITISGLTFEGGEATADGKRNWIDLDLDNAVQVSIDGTDFNNLRLGNVRKVNIRASSLKGAFVDELGWPPPIKGVWVEGAARHVVADMAFQMSAGAYNFITILGCPRDIRILGHQIGDFDMSGKFVPNWSGAVSLPVWKTSGLESPFYFATNDTLAILDRHIAGDALFEGQSMSGPIPPGLTAIRFIQNGEEHQTITLRFTGNSILANDDGSLPLVGNSPLRLNGGTDWGRPPSPPIPAGSFIQLMYRSDVPRPACSPSEPLPKPPHGAWWEMSRSTNA